jgi:hypothetical protein
VLSKADIQQIKTINQGSIKTHIKYWISQINVMVYYFVSASMSKRGRFTCMEVDPLLLVPTYAIHKAWQLCPMPKHQLKAAFLKSTTIYIHLKLNRYISGGGFLM